MKVIVLHGGIAAGKTTIARRLEAHGAARIDADQLARDAVAPGSPGLELIRQRFGAALIQDDGTLDRPALGKIVFADPAALADLNAIVHPEVRRLSAERIAQAERDGAALVVYEVPLLAELPPAERTTGDLVVVADAPAAIREQRLAEFRGMAPEDARNRIDSQASDTERRTFADEIIDTSGSEAQTLAQTDALWRRLTAR